MYVTTRPDLASVNTVPSFFSPVVVGLTGSGFLASAAALAFSCSALFLSSSAFCVCQYGMLMDLPFSFLLRLSSFLLQLSIKMSTYMLLDDVCTF
jgi:hypothetical protein